MQGIRARLRGDGVLTHPKRTAAEARKENQERERRGHAGRLPWRKRLRETQATRPSRGGRREKEVLEKGSRRRKERERAAGEEEEPRRRRAGRRMAGDGHVDPEGVKPRGRQSDALPKSSAAGGCAL